MKISKFCNQKSNGYHKHYCIHVCLNRNVSRVLKHCLVVYQLHIFFCWQWCCENNEQPEHGNQRVMSYVANSHPHVIYQMRTDHFYIPLLWERYQGIQLRTNRNVFCFHRAYSLGENAEAKQIISQMIDLVKESSNNSEEKTGAYNNK